jgi:hypothetical protein
MKHTFNSAEEAINTVIESSKNHANATDTGDYKTANKNYDVLKKAVTYLRENNETEKLKELLKYNDISVKVAAASYLLKNADQEAIAVLKEIASQSIPHHSFTAKLVLQEWQKGKLNL